MRFTKWGRNCFRLAALLVLGVTRMRAQATADALPGMIAFCEDSDGCADIVFQDKQGTGVWEGGRTGSFTFESLSAVGVALRRTDVEGVSRGLPALYTGRRMGNWVEGTYVANVAAKAGSGGSTGPQTGNWHALILPSAAVLRDAKFGASYRALLSGGAAANATAWKVCVDFGNACEGASPKPTEFWTLTDSVGRREDVADRWDTNPLFVDPVGSPDDPAKFSMRSLDTAGKYKGVARLFIGTREGEGMRGKVTLIAPGVSQRPFTRNWVATRVTVTKCERPEDASAGVETLKMAARLNSMLLDEAAAQRCGLMVAERGGR